MFETRFPQHVTRYAAELPGLQAGYADVWQGLRSHFDPNRRVWDGD
jgi:homogentisate 1,2-dioxygenase